MEFSKNSKIYVAGHNGLVGSAIVRELKKKGYKKIITSSKKKLDLTSQDICKIFKEKKTRFYFYSCCKSGGNLFK